MKGNTKRLFLDLAFNRDNGIDNISTGLEAGDIYLGSNAMINIANATACLKECRENCAPRAYSVKFAYPSDWDAYEELGIKIKIKRNAEFDNATLLDFPNSWWFSRNREKGDPLNARGIAIDIKEQIDAMNNDSITPKLFTAQYDMSDADADATTGTSPRLNIISEDCRYDFEVFYIGAPVSITTISEQIDGQLLRHQIQETFPLPYLLPGEDVPAYTQYCKNPCVITISGCTPACDDNFEEPILTGKARTFDFELWVDSEDPDYATFVTDLETQLGSTCTAEYAPGFIKFVSKTSTTATFEFTGAKGTIYGWRSLNPATGAIITVNSSTVNNDPDTITVTANNPDPGQIFFFDLTKSGYIARRIYYIEGVGLLAS